MRNTLKVLIAFKPISKAKKAAVQRYKIDLNKGVDSYMSEELSKGLSLE